jgi:protein-tyrosine-phosphatase
MAPALEGRADQHSSQRLTADLIDAADLVLTAAREHRAEVVSMSAQARPKTFTVRQAGRLAQWLLDAGMVEAARRDDVLYEQGDPRMVVAPLPQGDQARTAWLVDELDAARGMAPAPSEPEPQRRWGRRATDDQHPDDVPDPHVLGMGWHGPAYDQLLEATGQLVAVVRAMRA